MFTTGSLNLDGSNIVNGNVVTAINFYDPNDPTSSATPNPTINGVKFTGVAYNASSLAYTFTVNQGAGGIDDNRAGGVATTDAVYPLVYSGVYAYAGESLAVNNLTIGHTYSLQLFFDSYDPDIPGYLRASNATDGAVTSATIFTPGPGFITDTFTATSATETVAINPSLNGYPDEFSGFVLADSVPEPSTWVMSLLLAGIGGLALVRRHRAKTA